jgi:hypothetical protein
MNREAIVADYIDLCFATRLVNGMQKKQSFTRDVSLRYENQAVIDHIIATRQNRFSSSSSYMEQFSEEFCPGSRRNGVRRPSRSNSNDTLKSSSQEEDDSLREDDDDMMIFDMEL